MCRVIFGQASDPDGYVQVPDISERYSLVLEAYLRGCGQQREHFLVSVGACTLSHQRWSHGGLKRNTSPHCTHANNTLETSWWISLNANKGNSVCINGQEHSVGLLLEAGREAAQIQEQV